MSKRLFILGATLQLVLSGMNVALGILNLHRHRPLTLVAFSFVCAGLNLVLFVRLCFSHRRSMRGFQEILQLQQQHQQIAYQMAYQMAVLQGQVPIPMSEKALKFARENFSKIVAALGKNVKSASSERGAGDPHILFRIGEFDYLIRYGSVIKLKGDVGVASTCTQYQGGALPMEQVAAVALLLNHNPRLFEKWRDQHGYWSV